MKPKSLKTLLAVIAGTSVLGAIAQAEPVAVSNHSFENPALSSGGTTYVPLPVNGG